MSANRDGRPLLHTAGKRSENQNPNSAKLSLRLPRLSHRCRIWNQRGPRIPKGTPFGTYVEPTWNLQIVTRPSKSGPNMDLTHIPDFSFFTYFPWSGSRKVGFPALAGPTWGQPGPPGGRKTGSGTVWVLQNMFHGHAHAGMARLGPRGKNIFFTIF